MTPFKSLAACLLAGAALSFATAPMAVAQTAKPAAKAPYKAPRTVGGQPDLQGTWTNGSITTLERPTTYGDRKVMTPQEVAALEGDEAAHRERGNQPTDPSLTIADLPADCGRGFTGTNCGYNSGWTDPGSTIMRVGGEPRTSFLTTPNGRIPALKAGVQAPARTPLRPGLQQNDNPETRSLGERCLMSFGNSAGPIMLPLLYNNNYQFVQSVDAVAILVEMVHDTRVIRLNTKEHLPKDVRPWMGDSIGWWEGDTLVTETTNFPRAQAFRGSWENLKVTEKFTRVGADKLLYQFTVTDPTLWDQPWGGEYEFSRSDGLVYEYACHEGNYGLEGILAGARNDEKIAAEKAAGPRAEAPPATAVR